MQAEITLLLQSLPVLLAHHREAEAAPHATEDAQKSAGDTAAHHVSSQETPADGLNKSVISKLAQVWCLSYQQSLSASCPYHTLLLNKAWGEAWMLHSCFTI